MFALERISIHESVARLHSVDWFGLGNSHLRVSSDRPFAAELSQTIWLCLFV